MKTQRKKGFTMVELVIVIAVIAILAAVLIPTFVNLTKKANEAAALADARNIANQILANMLKGGDEAKDILVFEQKGDELYIHGYCAEAGRVLAYYGNPIKVSDLTGETLAEKVAAQLKIMAEKAEVQPAAVPSAEDWWSSEKMATAAEELGYSAETTVLRADYKIMPVNFVKDETPVDEGHDCKDSLTHYDKQEANCTQAGYEEYWICNKCGKMYSDAEAARELDKITITQALGHDYGDGDTCTRCGAEKPNNGGNNGGNTPAPNPNPNPGPEPNPEPEKSAEEQLVDKMNAAINGYNGESIMKALAYMADKDVSVTVSNLVHSDPTKTFAYDIAAHRFYIVNAANGTVEYPENTTAKGELVYVINNREMINANTTRIYINNIETIERSMFVVDATKLQTQTIHTFKANFVSVEIGAGVKKMETCKNEIGDLSNKVNSNGNKYRPVYYMGNSIKKDFKGKKTVTYTLQIEEGTGRYYWYNRNGISSGCDSNEYEFTEEDKETYKEKVRDDASYGNDPWQDCFYGCTTLESVYVGSSVTEMGQASFAKCTALSYIYYNTNATTTNTTDWRRFKSSGTATSGMTLEIGNKATSVPDLFGAPYELNLTSVVFEENSICKVIEEFAFYHAKITEITLPKSLSDIKGSTDSAAFSGCSQLQKIKWYGQSITCGGKTYNASNQESSGTGRAAFEAYMRVGGTHSLETNPTNLVIELITD